MLAASTEAMAAVDMPAMAPGASPWVASITVNGLHVDTALVLESDARWWSTEDVLRRFGLQTIAMLPLPSMQFRGQRYYDILATGAVAIDFNNAELTLKIEYPAHMLVGAGNVRRLGDGWLVVPESVPLSGFANYSVALDKSAASGFVIGADLELGMSSAVGLATTEFVATRVDERSRLIRYASSVRRDWPNGARTLIMGDSISRVGFWAQPVHFAGIHYYSNYGLQPGTMTYPMPRYEGLAMAPSSVAVFLNQGPAQAFSVKPGPFTISDVTVPGGTNEIVYVTKDALGREIVTRQTFYSFRELLREGLHDFSVEAGTLRRNLGISSFDYGTAYAALYSKYGITDYLTTVTEGRLIGKNATLGTSAIWSTPLNFGVIAAAIASKSANQSGMAVAFGVQRREPRWSLGADFRMYSRQFEFVQSDAGGAASVQQSVWSAFASRNLGAWGDVSIIVAGSRNYVAPPQQNAAFQWSQQWRGGWQLFFTASTGRSGSTRVSSAGISVTVPLSRTRSISSGVSRSNDGKSTLQTAVTERQPLGIGYGWRASVQSVLGSALGSQPTAEARVTARASAFDARLDASRDAAGISTRAEMSGAVGFVDGTFFSARRIEDAFALVKVEGNESVGLLRNGVIFARTNGAGVAVVPRLEPYASNTIDVDVRSLPLDVEADPPSINLVAPFRGAAVGTVRLKKSASALVRVVDASGQPLSRGGEVLRAGNETTSTETFVVGSDGKVYLTQLAKHNKFVFKNSGNMCTFEFDVPPERFEPSLRVTDILRIGPILCDESKQ